MLMPAQENKTNMRNKTLKYALTLAALSLFICAYGAFAATDAPPVSPLPLAKNAKTKPDEMPDGRRERELLAVYVQANALIGAHDYDGLEKLAQGWLDQYRAKKISGDQYLERMSKLAPRNAGTGMLNDLLAWTQARPGSYIAWYTLGAQYVDIAWDQRGTAYANKTTAEQFEAMYKYSALGQAALQRSLKLSPDPLPSYAALMNVAPIAGKPRSGDGTGFVAGAIKEMFAKPQRFCPGKYAADGIYPSTWEEQLYYLCLALHSDPNVTKPFEFFVFYNSPRWGGNYARVEKMLGEIEADKRTSTTAFNEMWALLLQMKASDAHIANDPHRAAELFVQGFHLAPLPEHISWLYTAAGDERDKLKSGARSREIYAEILKQRPNDGNAMQNIGFIYDEAGDLQHYMEYMIPAANLGMKEAQNNLGYYYMVGQRGLPRDLQQAKEWLTLAANQGYEHAREKIAVVEAMIEKEKKK
ncbi:MAG: hypothetical protein JWN73_3665 [Betaproteobacteria bacterium]|nr:hypothetical protein [Betaproteobacteria bacterium]